VESIWGYGFAVANRLFHPQINFWSSPGQQHILVIAPHPDDEAIGCAGTLIWHKRGGDTVCVAYITDGRKSRALGLNAQEMVRRRRQEAEAGAKALGIDRFEWLGFPEGGWTVGQLQPRLQNLIEEFVPHIIYTPSRIDFHPEHQKVAYALAQLLPPNSVESPTLQIRIYQIHVPLTPLLTNLVVDTSDVAAETAAALSVYVTQHDSIFRTIRQRRYAARLYRTEKHAEEFWQMTAHRYCLLHSLPPTCRPIHTFRGLRFHPFSDPLAYLQGLSERLRLAGLTQSASCHL
jgi:LmbE family N-acetylglucosaminyl deacetylase